MAEQTLRRIPTYHQILSDLEKRGEEYVSSANLARYFEINHTQVRKDVSVLGYKGKPKSGYSVKGLKAAIEGYLGINVENTAVLIGAGKLGSALCRYPGLADYGLRIVAVFDNDPAKIGTMIGDFVVASLDSLVSVVQRCKIGIAIVTVPAQAAQQACHAAVSMGIRAIWNFAPTQLSVPLNVVVRNENLAVGIALLSYYLKAGTSPADGRRG